MKPVLVLDRDGVINEDSDAFVKCPEEWVAIPGSLEAIARANHLGYRVVVLTNQSGLARGLFDMGGLNSIHQKLVQQLGAVGGSVDAFFVCPHLPEANCECRKPNAGMLRELSERLRISLDDTFVVGDRISDIEAARKVGAKPILVRTGKGEATLDAANDADLRDVPVFKDLAEMVDQLLVKRPA
jgi:D-glycero-D-manno-heptose 1,7-bisphosphate phosphatase